MSFTRSDLESKNLKKLRKLCTDLQIQGRSKLKKKQDIINKILILQTNTVAAVKRQAKKDIIDTCQCIAYFILLVKFIRLLINFIAK